MQTSILADSAATVAVVATGCCCGTPPSTVRPPRASRRDAPRRDARHDVDAGGARGPRCRAPAQSASSTPTCDGHRAATRTAQDAVKDLDVEVLVADAMQDVPDVAMLAGRPRMGCQTRDVTADEAKAGGTDRHHRRVRHAGRFRGRSGRGCRPDSRHRIVDGEPSAARGSSHGWSAVPPDGRPDARLRARHGEEFGVGDPGRFTRGR